jgi:hypothetical protein
VRGYYPTGLTNVSKSAIFQNRKNFKEGKMKEKMKIALGAIAITVIGYAVIVVIFSLDKIFGN